MFNQFGSDEFFHLPLDFFYLFFWHWPTLSSQGCVLELFFHMDVRGD